LLGFSALVKEFPGSLNIEVKGHYDEVLTSTSKSSERFGRFHAILDRMAFGITDASRMWVQYGRIKSSRQENSPRKPTGLARVGDVTLKRGIIGSLALYQHYALAFKAPIRRTGRSRLCSVSGSQPTRQGARVGIPERGRCSGEGSKAERDRSSSRKIPASVADYCT
jgi:hypothetical protein